MKTAVRLLCTAFVIASLFLPGETAAQPLRKVLIEEFTTASCGNCPMMSQYIRTWHEANAANTIMVSIHEGSGVDAMSNANTAAIFNAMHPTGGWFAPAAMIERAIYPSTNGEAYLSCYQSWGSPGGPGIDTIATRLMGEPPIVAIEISGTYNATTRTIDATVSATFLQTIPSGDWRINLFLVEDSVVGWPGLGAFAGWDQHCYDAAWANTYYPGMFDGTSIIGYPHRHVMRNSLMGNWGVAGVIPSVPVTGTAYTASASLTVDTAFHDDHLSLVAFVSSYGSTKADKFVLNANDVRVENNFATTAGDMQPLISSVTLSPVPAAGNVRLAYYLYKGRQMQIQLYDLTGKLVSGIYSGEQQAGYHQMDFSTAGLAAGLYLIRLENDQENRMLKLIVE